MATDPAAPPAATAVPDDLTKCLDIMVRSGVAQARAIEDRIATMRLAQKTA